MQDPTVPGNKTLLFVAHPGHELLLHGWIRRVKPLVCIITDGGGPEDRSRIAHTAEWLRSMDIPAGSIFGRFTDREAYAALLSGDVEWIDSLVTDLARELVTRQISLVVADAAEGFNPVHDLCQVIAGAAITLAAKEGVATVHCEYPIHDGPMAYDQCTGEVVRDDLDDAALAMKLADARHYAEVIPDVQSMIEEFGEAAFRRESFRRTEDWTVWPWPPGERPLYEQIGEERVASGRYAHVLRHAEHMLPLVEHLRARVRSTASSATASGVQAPQLTGSRR
jgi:hypothetical protein